jgi:hypothetical protein
MMIFQMATLAPIVTGKLHNEIQPATARRSNYYRCRYRYSSIYLPWRYCHLIGENTVKSSPIYNIINNPSRLSSCSFGAVDGFEQDIRVGTSSTNSHTLGTIAVKRHKRKDGTVWFALFLDGTYIKGGLLAGKQYVPYGSETMPQ